MAGPARPCCGVRWWAQGALVQLVTRISRDSRFFFLSAIRIFDSFDYAIELGAICNFPEFLEENLHLLLLEWVRPVSCNCVYLMTWPGSRPVFAEARTTGGLHRQAC